MLLSSIMRYATHFRQELSLGWPCPSSAYTLRMYLAVLAKTHASLREAQSPMDSSPWAMCLPMACGHNNGRSIRADIWQEQQSPRPCLV